MLRRRMRSLRRDPVFVSAVAVVAALVVAAFALPLGAVQRQAVSDWSDFLLLALAVVAAWQALQREQSPSGRRFWRYVTVSLVVWYAALVQWWVVADKDWNLGSDVLSDCLYLAYYLGLVTATATRPHERREAPSPSAIVSTEVAAAGVLAFGLLTYFVILPSRFAPRAYETFVPSLSLYVLMDVVLVARLAWWCRTTASSWWRPTYCALAAALSFSLLHDVHELLVYRAGQSLEPSPWDLVWWGQFLALVAAARLSVHRSAVAAEQAPRETGGAPVGAAVFGPVASYAFILPVVHLGGGLAGLLDPGLDRPRETLVLACALVLGGLAVLHTRLTDRRYRLTRESLYAAQTLLQQSRKMEALGRLAGVIAHDFNNLLSVIIGYADLLAERLTMGDRLLDPVGQIRQAAERAATLTRQLAVVSRGQLAREGLFDVDLALSALAPTVQRLAADRVTLSVEPGAAGAWVGADRDQFERAIINIAANARDAMPEGGTFRIATRRLELSEGESRLHGSLPAGSYVVMELADTGVGMSEEVRSKVFEPFFTTKPEEAHRGLGLAVVYGIVRHAGGHIEVESSEGEGTLVRIFLPRRESRPENQSIRESPPAEDRPLTVLVAEDERGLRRLMCSGLERAGFKVLEAADGRAAVDVGEQYPGRIDLLVSDVVMPGCGGPEAARRLLAGRPEMRVMFVSGYAPESLGDLRVTDGEVVLLPKPFTIGELASRARATVLGRG